MKTCFSIASALAFLLPSLKGAEPLTLAKTIPLHGVTGRFDHFALDVKGQRLFVAALGNNTLEVIDVAGSKRLHTIKSLSKPTGVAFLPDENLICVANGNDGSLRVFDGQSYQLRRTLINLDDADNVRYDSKNKRLYVGYGDGALAAIDPGKWEVISSIKLPAHPESFQLDPSGAQIWVNLPDAKQVSVLDRLNQKVVATWPINQFQANFPMALNLVNHRLFVGCRQPPQVVVFDTTAGKPVANFPVSGDTDDLFYDPNLKRLYVSCGEGYLDAFQNSDQDKWTWIQTLATSPGARTCYFSPDLKQLYLAVPQKGLQQAEVRSYSTIH
ncbi:MAG: pyrrolo-quinoline quinone beta-propeller repeat-containing protein [Verrucomicrobiales bacterium]|nr:pyrrolo-quinoline quinone beta-propeller repeat-containing protein [Verrucomicrobiales bacterium]